MASTPEPLSSLETPAGRRRDRHLGAIVFTAVVFLGFWILSFVMKFDLLPSVHARHLDGAVYAVLGAAMLIVLWIEMTIDRR